MRVGGFLVSDWRQKGVLRVQGYNPSRPPRSWQGAGVRSWRTRRQPRNARALFRGVTPRGLGMPSLDYINWSVPTLGIYVGYGRVLVIGLTQGRWLSIVPLNGGTHPSHYQWRTDYPARCFSASLSLATRCQLLWSRLTRGLGGVCRLKLRYRGKSFRWHRRRGGFLLRFGHSHLVSVPTWPGVRWRRFGRTKVLIYGADWWGLVMFAQVVCWWRPINVYHGRGLRLRRQVILRKAGKVSTYR